MRRLVLSAAVLMFSASIFAATASPVKFSLWDHKAWPANADTLKGLELGFGGITPEVIGVQYELVKGVATKVTGAQLGIWQTTDVLTGVQSGVLTTVNGSAVGAQLGWINFNHGRMHGAQVGIYNQAANLRGVQLGFVNNAAFIEKGLQIGLVNIAKNGWLPVMVIVNGKF